MDIVIILAPMALVLSLCFVAAFIWATKSGQWDDLDLPPTKLIEQEKKMKPQTKDLK